MSNAASVKINILESVDGSSSRIIQKDPFIDVDQTITDSNNEPIRDDFGQIIIDA